MKRRTILAGTNCLLAGGLTAGWLPSVLAQSATVKFGQSASLTGGQAHYGTAVRDGIAAAFQAANKSDRSRGARFELVTLDDGGDREKCKANVQTLIDNGVVGLVGLTSGAAAEACIPLVEAAQIPMLGTATGNMGLRAAGVRYAFHVRAGYDDEYRKLLRYIKDYAMRRIGYVYLKDTSAANKDAMTAALKAEALEMTVSVGIDRNAKSFDEEAKQLVAAKLDCVLFTTNAAPILPIIDRMLSAKYLGLFFSSSFAGQGLIDATLGTDRFIVMTQVVPRPTADAFPVVKAYQRDLAALGANTKIGFTSLEGYIAGRVAIDATRAALAGGAVSRPRLVEALSHARFDLGGYVVNFEAGSRTGSRFVDVVAFGKSGRLVG